MDQILQEKSRLIIIFFMVLFLCLWTISVFAGGKFCPYCGEEISPDARFCSYCGQELEGEKLPKIKALWNWNWIWIRHTRRWFTKSCTMSWLCKWLRSRVSIKYGILHNVFWISGQRFYFPNDYEVPASESFRSFSILWDWFVLWLVSIFWLVKLSLWVWRVGWDCSCLLWRNNVLF